MASLSDSSRFMRWSGVRSSKVRPVLYGNTTSVLFPGAIPKTLEMVDLFEKPECASHPEWSLMAVSAVTGIEKDLETFCYEAFKAMTAAASGLFCLILRIRAAERFGLTLIGKVRPGSFVVYTGNTVENE